MLLTLLLACTGAQVKNSANAPFSVSGSAAVWAVSSENDADEGEAILLLSDGQSDCDALTKGNLLNDIDDTDIEGTGLMFAFMQEDAGSDFTGLWMSGYAYGSDGAERSMVMLPFADGFFYISYGWYYGVGSTTWVRIDKDDDKVSGEFASDYWSGSFSAENCGEWDEPERHRDSW